jgi:hypothetical protein
MNDFRPLEPTFSKAVPAFQAPAFNAANPSFFATTSFIYTLLFVVIITSAFFMYGKAALLRIQLSGAGRARSNEEIRRVTLGLLGGLLLFPLLYTFNRDLLLGDIGLSGLKAVRPGVAQGGGGNVTNNNTNTTNPSNTPVSSGPLVAAIVNAANSYRGASTADAPGTNFGRLACAYAVNEVLKIAGVAPIDNLNVASMEQGLQGGRGTRVTQSEAQAGDIVIEAGASHVGICLNSGCTQVLSNSSSKASFSWTSGPDFSPSYSNGIGRFYRVNN